MKDFDQNNITDAVVASMGGTPNPRLRQIMTSLVRHLHGFVREVELSVPEWEAAIAFLTRTGKTCDEHRQEFILLSDVLGISMLVDAVNHHATDGTTETTVLGPFFVHDAPEVANGSDISGGLTGQPLFVTGSVASESGYPLANAVVDVWHADDGGFYDVQQSSKLVGLAGRARLHTDEAGKFSFWSVVPRWYPIPDDGPVGDLLKATNRHPNRPAHVHFMIGAPSYRTLVTHLFASDTPYLDSDAVFGVKTSLIVAYAEKPAGLAPDGRMMPAPYRHLHYDFGLTPSSQLSVLSHVSNDGTSKRH